MIICVLKNAERQKGYAKTNYIDPMDKWEQGPRPGHRETHTYTRTSKVANTQLVFVLTAIHDKLKGPQRSEEHL